MRRPRVLIVDDDHRARDAACEALREGGFEPTASGDAAAVLRELAALDHFDLVVLDVMLPGGVNGFDICRTIRTVSGVPIIMVTARTETADVVTGLELGADDYMTKPFEPAELVARARATVRRGAERNARQPSDVLALRDLEIDVASFRARRRGEELPLTTIELRLLIEMAHHVDQVLTRDVLLERVWGYDYLGDSRLVDMAVRRLRAKLGEPPVPPAYITTLRGVGYRLERG